ncbi:MAG TPA: CHASE2 domain-containing protein [Coleofasciculaceae cyanobacterium]
MPSKLKVSQKGWLATLTTAPVVAGLVIGVQLTGFFQLLEWATYDLFFRLRPSESVDNRLLIVTIDESDINYLKQWPLSDASLAQVVKTLNQYQPAGIGLDLYRDLPVKPGHQQWLEVMKSTPNLIGVEKAIGKTVAPPPILSQLDRVAVTDLVVDADGKVRRALLSYEISQNQVRFGLGTHLALKYLEARGITLEVADQTKKHYRLGRALFTPFLGNNGGYVRTNSGGYQILLNYRGQKDRFHTIPLEQVLKNKVKPELIRDRIVLIGSLAPSLNDELYTPYSGRFIETPHPTPGVVIHANVTSQILSAALDGRPLIHTWAEPIDWLWIFIWSTLGATWHWGVLEIDQRRKKCTTRWKVLTLYLFLSGGVLIAGSYCAFLVGWWIPIVSPIVALIGSALAISGYQVLKLQQQRAELTRQNLAMEKEKIKAEAASQAKSQFLAKMSHELRTPLNAILGFTQLLNHDTSLSQEQQEYLSIIMRSGEHLLALINDILEMSKIEAGHITLHENTFDLYRLLNTLAEMFRLKAQSKGLQLFVEQTPEVPRYVITDEGKLRQVLINLLGNAVKFTESGQVVLRVKIGHREHDIGYKEKNTGIVRHSNVPMSYALSSDTRLFFEVSDTGPGISPEDIDTLFEAFSQTSSGEKFVEGSGLGLAISRQFVQLLGGDITVSSNVGQGATFIFDIPVAVARKDDTETTQVRGRVMGLAPNQSGYRILVAEDNWANRQLLVKLLVGMGFQVKEAQNGKEAVALWSSWEPHLILMDMRMPVMDGYEATKHIKSQVKGQATAIIALTAHAFSEQRNHVLAAGCDDFVSKPFREDVLWSKIAEHLGVSYVYQESEDASSSQFKDKLEVVTEESLAVMPKEWLAQLYLAAAVCHEEEVSLLLEQIPPSHVSLKLALADLVNNYRFDVILNLTQAFAQESSSTS